MKIIILIFVLCTSLAYSNDDNKIHSMGIDLDKPLKSTKNNEVKALIKDILEDIEDSIEGSSNSRYRAVRIVEGTVNNFNVKKAGLNLTRAFGYYSNEYKGLFLDLMTSKLMTHGIETGASAIATIIQLSNPALTGFERTALGFVQSLAVPGAVDFLCWIGDACFISFYSYRKTMRKIRLNLVKVPKKMGINKLWSLLYTKVDGELLIDQIISSNNKLNTFIVSDKMTKTYRLMNSTRTKTLVKLGFDKTKKGLNLKTMTFPKESLSAIPQKEFDEFLKLFNYNLKEAGKEAKTLLSANKVEKLNKMFHIDEVISTNHINGTDEIDSYVLKIRNNTITLKNKNMRRTKVPRFCSEVLMPFL